MFLHRRFPLKFAKYFRTAFFQNTSGKSLLTICSQSFFPMIKATYLILKVEIPSYQFSPVQNLDILCLYSFVNQGFDKMSLREKCPDTEFFLVRIFPRSDWIRRDPSCLFVSLRIQYECGKMRTRKNSIFGPISHSV